MIHHRFRRLFAATTLISGTVFLSPAQADVVTHFSLGTNFLLVQDTSGLITANPDSALIWSGGGQIYYRGNLVSSKTEVEYEKNDLTGDYEWGVGGYGDFGVGPVSYATGTIPGVASGSAGVILGTPLMTGNLQASGSPATYAGSSGAAAYQSHLEYKLQGSGSIVTLALQLTSSILFGSAADETDWAQLYAGVLLWSPDDASDLVANIVAFSGTETIPNNVVDLEVSKYFSPGETVVTDVFVCSNVRVDNAPRRLMNFKDCDFGYAPIVAQLPEGIATDVVLTSPPLEKRSIPEPAAIGILASSLLILASMRRRFSF